MLATHLLFQFLKPGRPSGFFTLLLLFLLLNSGYSDVTTLEALAGNPSTSFFRGIPDFRVQKDSQWTFFSAQAPKDSTNYLKHQYSWNHLYSENRKSASLAREMNFTEGRHNMQLHTFLPWNLRLFTALQSRHSIISDKSTIFRSAELSVSSVSPLTETQLGLRHQLLNSMSQSIQIGMRDSDFSEARYAVMLPFFWISYTYQKPVYEIHSALNYSSYQDTFTVAIQNQQHHLQLFSESEFYLRALNPKNAFQLQLGADYNWIHYDDHNHYVQLSDSGRVLSWSATLSNTIFSATTLQQDHRSWNLAAHIQQTSKESIAKAWASEKSPKYPFGRFKQTTSLVDAGLSGSYKIRRINAEPAQSFTVSGGLQQSSALIEPAGSYSRKFVLDFRQIPKSMSESLLNQFANETWMFGSHLNIDNYYLETHWKKYWNSWLRTDLLFHQYMSHLNFFTERKHTESQLFLMYENTYYYDKMPEILAYSLTTGGSLTVMQKDFELEFGLSQWLPLWTHNLQPGTIERKTSSSEEQSEFNPELNGLAQSPSSGSQNEIYGGFACYSSLIWKW